MRAHTCIHLLNRIMCINFYGSKLCPSPCLHDFHFCILSVFGLSMSSVTTGQYCCEMLISVDIFCSVVEFPWRLFYPLIWESCYICLILISMSVAECRYQLGYWSLPDQHIRRDTLQSCGLCFVIGRVVLYILKDYIAFWMSGTTCLTTPCQISGDWNHQHYCENLESLWKGCVSAQMSNCFMTFIFWAEDMNFIVRHVHLM